MNKDKIGERDVYTFPIYRPDDAEAFAKNQRAAGRDAELKTDKMPTPWGEMPVIRVLVGPRPGAGVIAASIKKSKQRRQQ
jgi:hypothetical protein